MTSLEHYTHDMLPIAPLSESDFHGASFILNKLYNSNLVSPIIGKTLKHGWTPNRFIKDIRQVIHWGEKTDLHLCFNHFQEKYLHQNGFDKTLVVGAPYIHALKLVSQLEIKKIPNSLLIMPQHTLKHIDPKNSCNDFLINAIQIGMKEKFTKIALCVHRQSLNQGLIDFANDNNIQLITGASEFDSKSLINQAILFSYFKNIITNSVGSHVVYGLSTDCAVKLINLYQHTEEELNQHPWYLANPQVMKIGLENQRHTQDIYPELFKEEWNKRENLNTFLNEEIPSPDKDLNFIFNKEPSLKWRLKNYFYYMKFNANLDGMRSKY